MKKIKNIFWSALSMFVIFPAIFAQAETKVGSVDAKIDLKNPLGNVKTLEQLVQIILGVVVKIGAVVAVFFVIYAGFLFVKARGNPEELEKAKTTFMWTIIGAVVLLGAQVISYVITGTVGDIRSAAGISN